MGKISGSQLRSWVRRISQSDKKAFDRLFRHYYARLVRFSCQYVNNKAIASDIVQEGFVRIWQKRQSLDPNKSIKAYLYQMVRNRSLNYLRDHSKETVGLEPLKEVGLEARNGEENAGDSDERSELLKQWIKDLPKRQREAFELSRFEGLDHDEIAEVMGISANTVNNHIVAALENLRSRSVEYQDQVKK